MVKHAVFKANFVRIRKASAEWNSGKPITHEELAKLVDVSVHTIDAWARGKRAPGGANLARLAAVLRVHPKEFFRHVPPTEPVSPH